MGHASVYNQMQPRDGLPPGFRSCSPRPHPAAPYLRRPMKIGEHAAPHSSIKNPAPAPRPAGIVATLVTWACVLGVVGGSGYAYYRYIYLPSQTPIAAPPRRPIPVLAAPARLGDMSLYLNGLGTVTAFNSVTVRSRVEGELIEVAFKEGQKVEKGALLARIDPRPYQVALEQAEGPLARDRAANEIAVLNLERFQQLAKSKSISQQEIDTQASLVKQTEAQIQTDLAQIDDAKLQLEYCNITSPLTGRVGLRLVDQGNMIRSGEAGGIAVVTQLQPISVVFTIPQDEIARVQKRMKSGEPLTVEAFNRDFTTRLAAGTLSALDNQVDATTGTVRLKATFDNEDEMLFPNQFVNVRLLVDTQQKVVLVPTAAVQRGQNFIYVYVLKPGEKSSTVELRKITLGATEGTEVIVVEGLAAGEQVVTDGLEKLQNGAAVTMRDPNKKPSTDEAPKPAAADAAPSATSNSTPGGTRKGA